MFAYYQRRPVLSRALLRESLFADAPWAERFTGQVAKVHGTLARLTTEAIARGELRSEASAPLFGVAWFSFFYFALISWAQGAHPTPVTMVDHLVAQHLDGLRPRKSKPPKRRSRR